MKGNRVADLRAEAPTNSRPDSKRGLKATIKLQQEAIKTQLEQIETLKTTSQRPFEHGGSLENNGIRFGESPFKNLPERGSFADMASRYPFEGGPLLDSASKKLRGDHKDRLDHLSKEPNAQPVAQSIFGYEEIFRERRAKLAAEPDCSNCRIIETQQMEDKDLIQRLHEKIAELEAIKEPTDSCIDKTETDWLSQILENNDAELRDSYEAAFKAIFEGQQQEDKDTIACLLSRIADLENCIEGIGRIDNEIRERLDRVIESQVVMGPQEDLAARLQEKMEKLDAALGRLTAAEDEEAKGPAALIDREQETTREKRNEGRCIVS